MAYIDDFNYDDIDSPDSGDEYYYEFLDKFCTVCGDRVCYICEECHHCKTERGEIWDDF